MQAEIEFLEHLDGGGWWLRFRSRSTPTFQATKEQIKTLIAYPDRLWVPEAYGGRGAWFIEERALAQIGHLFSNYALLRWWAEEAERLRVHAAQAEAARQRREAEQRQQAMPLRPPTTYQQAFTLLGLPVSASRRRMEPRLSPARTSASPRSWRKPSDDGGAECRLSLGAGLCPGQSSGVTSGSLVAVSGVSWYSLCGTPTRGQMVHALKRHGNVPRRMERGPEGWKSGGASSGFAARYLVSFCLGNGACGCADLAVSRWSRTLGERRAARRVRGMP